MLTDEDERCNTDGITHSPYYGCTVRVISKANVSYEGVLDGITKGKDRLFLRNVRVNGNLSDEKFERKRTMNDGDDDDDDDDLNVVMINHLVKDIHVYEQVCLNVRDIKEMNLLHLPPTFNEAKEKLRSIDPCLVDIRLSSSDQFEISKPMKTLGPIARRPRTESNGSLGSNAMGFSSSNESSSSLPEAIRIEQELSRFHLNQQRTSNDTLLAKKVLPKRNDRRTDQRTLMIHTRKPNNEIHQRKVSPMKISITSKLNPNAMPFYGQQRNRNQYRTLQSITSLPTEPFNNRNQLARRSTASLGSNTNFLYQRRLSNDHSQRTARTFSSTSSNSSISIEIVPTSTINNKNSNKNPSTSEDGQYDFEKANKEFRRYLELEELVSRSNPSISGNGSNLDEKSISSPYKKEVSFFDRISCTATTGTAVAYTEIDELEKNRETFGDDALLLLTSDDGDGQQRF